MGRKKRSMQNIAVALASEVLVTVVGMFFPSAIILNYGSKVNGLITSLQQMMQYFTLLGAGFSGAVLFALYKPLADENTTLVCRILSAAKKLYLKIGGIFVLIVLLISAIYPMFIADVGYPDWVVTALFCLIASNGATQLLFVGKYKALLTASQNHRYVALINSLTTCMFSLVIIFAAYCKLHVVAAVALGCTAYLVRIVGYWLITKKLFPQYLFDSKDADYQLKNQKEVFIENILSMIVMYSNVLLLSFSKTDMAEVSVFTVYNMILTAVFMLTNTVPQGVSASFGDLISRNNIEKLQRSYMHYELLYQIFWTVIFSCTSVLYYPFIAVYTSRFTDAVYIRPVLCVLFSVFGAIWSIRIQQISLTVAAGKYKEIQKSSILEAILTILLSAVGLSFSGLEGLMLGRCLAAGYRMIDLIQFNHRYVLQMNAWLSWKGILASTAAIFIVNLLSGQFIQKIVIDNYLIWGVYACIIGVLSCAISLLVNTAANKEIVREILQKRRNDSF